MNTNTAKYKRVLFAIEGLCLNIRCCDQHIDASIAFNAGIEAVCDAVGYSSGDCAKLKRLAVEKYDQFKETPTT